MQIYVNGEAREVPPGTTIAGLVAELGLAGQRVAVEVNQEIAPRSTHQDRALREGDRVEVVRAIGGGRG